MACTVCLSESAGDDRMKDYGPFTPQCNDTCPPSSLYMESRELSAILFAIINNVL